MGLVYQMNKGMEQILPLVNAHPESGLRVVYQPIVDGEPSLWPWGLTHEATQTFMWFEGSLLCSWGANVGKADNILKPLAKLGVFYDDCF